MCARRLDEDILELTLRETAILSALAERPHDTLAISRECAADANGELMGAGTLYPALKRLARGGFIHQIPAEEARNPGKPRKVYALTAAGQMVLEWQMARLEGMVSRARERLDAC